MIGSFDQMTLAKSTLTRFDLELRPSNGLQRGAMLNK